MSLRRVCAWCDRLLAEEASDGGGVTHGICAPCLLESGALPVSDLSALSPEALEALPYGAIQVDPEGRVLRYTQAEARLSGRDPARVVGRNFFTEVAPCSDVPEFRGAFDRIRAADATERSAHLAFAFTFAEKPTLVSVALTYDPLNQVGTILVRPEPEGA